MIVQGHGTVLYGQFPSASFLWWKFSKYMWAFTGGGKITRGCPSGQSQCWLTRDTLPPYLSCLRTPGLASKSLCSLKFWSSCLHSQVLILQAYAALCLLLFFALFFLLRCWGLNVGFPVCYTENPQISELCSQPLTWNISYWIKKLIFACKILSDAS